MKRSVDLGEAGPAVVCPAGGASTETDPGRGSDTWSSRTVDNYAQPGILDTRVRPAARPCSSSSRRRC